MSLLSVFCILSLGILNVLANAAVVKNNRPKGWQFYAIWLFYLFSPIYTILLPLFRFGVGDDESPGVKVVNRKTHT